MYLFSSHETVRIDAETFHLSGRERPKAALRNYGVNDPTAVDEICLGWFLQIKAKKKFAFQHGGEIIPITNGADIRSHMNIVTNYENSTVVPITTTRD